MISKMLKTQELKGMSCSTEQLIEEIEKIGFKTVYSPDSKEEIKCFKCENKFINAYDPIEKKISKYQYKPTCKCMPKNFRLSVG